LISAYGGFAGVSLDVYIGYTAHQVGHHVMTKDNGKL